MYALIPDGYTLEKVTKLQKQAVDAKRRHDNVEAFLNNPNTPVLIGGAGFVALSGIVLNLLFGVLEEEGVKFTEAEKSELIKKAFLTTTPIGLTISGVSKLFESISGLGLDFGQLEGAGGKGLA